LDALRGGGLSGSAIGIIGWGIALNNNGAVAGVHYGIPDDACELDCHQMFCYNCEGTEEYTFSPSFNTGFIEDMNDIGQMVGYDVTNIRYDEKPEDWPEDREFEPTLEGDHIRAIYSSDFTSRLFGGNAGNYCREGMDGRINSSGEVIVNGPISEGGEEPMYWNGGEGAPWPIPGTSWVLDINDNGDILVDDYSGAPAVVTPYNAPRKISAIAKDGSHLESVSRLRGYSINNCGQIVAQSYLANQDYRSVSYLLNPRFFTRIFSPDPITMTGDLTLEGIFNNREIRINRKRECTFLKDIYLPEQDNTDGCLSGPYAKHIGTTEALAATCTKAFVYEHPRTAPGFDAAMVYHHASAALKFAEGLGVKIAKHLPGSSDEEAAYFTRSSLEGGYKLVFSDQASRGKVDASEDAKVIWHEVGHAVWFVVKPLLATDDLASAGEQTALLEALADFFAVNGFINTTGNALIDDVFNPLVGTWLATGTPIDQLPADQSIRAIRSLADETYHYPDGYTADVSLNGSNYTSLPHTNSAVVSWSLWKVYQQLKAAGDVEAGRKLLLVIREALGEMRKTDGFNRFAEYMVVASDGILSEPQIEILKAGLVEKGLLVKLVAVDVNQDEVAPLADITGEVVTDQIVGRLDYEIEGELTADDDSFEKLEVKANISPKKNFGSFSVRAPEVTVNTNCTLTLKAGGYKYTKKIKILAVSMSLDVSTNSIVGGKSITAAISLLRPAPAGGFLADITSSDPLVQVPARVRVPEGLTLKAFRIRTPVVATALDATITAKSGTQVASQRVTALPASLSSLAIKPRRVRRGLAAEGTVRFNGAAPVGGRVLTLEAIGIGVTAPEQVLLAAGQTTVTFPITVEANARLGAATIRVSSEIDGVVTSKELSITVIR
jgi:hypothetical protein